MQLAAIVCTMVLAAAVGGCESPEITGTEDPSMANLDPPENPELCRPACEILNDDCAADDDRGDIEVIRGCVESCLEGEIEDAVLECLAVADCSTADECLE